MIPCRSKNFSEMLRPLFSHSGKFEGDLIICSKREIVFIGMAAELDPQLDLKIADVSSEMAEFPADTILEGDPLSEGWRTRADILPPHFISLEIVQGLAEISQIEFVAHETFVPLNVEVFYKSGDKYEKLGHVKMNESTEGRERKTFKIKIRATDIKLVMHDVIPNNGNFDNEVSLTSLIVRGKLCEEMRPGSAAMSSVDNRAMPDAVKQQISHNEVYNDKIIALINELALDESKFVQEDQYLEAERVKIASAKILNFAKALDALEIKKALAVKKKDYKAAATIKENIDEIKSLINEDYQDMICILNNEPKRPKPVHEATTRQEESLQIQKQGSTAKVSQEEKLSNAEENKAPEEEIPETNTDHNEDRPINAEEEQGYGFELSEEEKVEIEAERLRRAEEMKRERLSKIGKSTNAPIKKEEVAHPTERRTNAEVGDEPLAVSRTDCHFETGLAFNFDSSMSQLTSYWEGSDEKPPVLPPNVAHTDECNILLASRFSEIFVRLLCSKNMEHVSDAVLFMDEALEEDAARFCDPGIALVDILGQNNNLALLNHANKIFIRCYVGLLLKHAELSLTDFDLQVFFDNVEEALMEEKDAAVLYAEICIGNNNNKTAQEINEIIQKSVEGNISFAGDVLRLVDAPYNRITEKEHRAFIEAINMLSTVASLPAFPDREFFNQLLEESQIARQSELKAEEQTFQNEKYIAIVEARAVAASMMLQEAPWLISQQTYQILLEFIEFALPFATKTEFKNAMMLILGFCYEADEFVQLSDMIELLEKMELKNEKIKEEIDTLFKNSDLKRDGSQRIVYNEEKKGFTEANNTLMFTENLDEFGPGVCEFCLYDTKNVDIKVMHKHLLLDCPCCTICPACKMLVEIPFISEHLLFSCQAKGNYHLTECPKCMNAYDVAEYELHIDDCEVKLKGEESACPLCGIICPDGEASLIHHSDGLCISNVRTSLELKNVVRTKVEGK